jgi:hypothetical protein
MLLVSKLEDDNRRLRHAPQCDTSIENLSNVSTETETIRTIIIQLLSSID